MKQLQTIVLSGCVASLIFSAACNRVEEKNQPRDDIAIIGLEKNLDQTRQAEPKPWNGKAIDPDTVAAYEKLAAPTAAG